MNKIPVETVLEDMENENGLIASGAKAYYDMYYKGRTSISEDSENRVEKRRISVVYATIKEMLKK